MKGDISIEQAYRIVTKEEDRQKYFEEAARTMIKLPSGIKLINNDFRCLVQGNEIPDNSIPLIFVDPPYEGTWLPYYKDLGKLAMRVLQPGGSLVTYLGDSYLDVVIENLKASGLKCWYPFHVVLAGGHSSVHFKKVIACSKTLLWFVKGDRLRAEITHYVPNLIYSSPSDKLLHSKEWEQSPVEAEHVIKYLTLPNETVCDFVMGTGTTGIAAINLQRQFIGVEIDKEEFETAQIKISKHFATPCMTGQEQYKPFPSYEHPVRS